jgi:hypothetical protein
MEGSSGFNLEILDTITKEKSCCQKFVGLFSEGGNSKDGSAIKRMFCFNLGIVFYSLWRGFGEKEIDLI